MVSRQMGKKATKKNNNNNKRKQSWLPVFWEKKRFLKNHTHTQVVEKNAFQFDNTEDTNFQGCPLLKLWTSQKKNIETYLPAGLEGVYQLECVHETDVYAVRARSKEYNICPFYPCVTAVARKRPWSLCQKCRRQVTPKRAYTFDPTKSECADYAAVQA